MLFLNVSYLSPDLERITSKHQMSVHAMLYSILQLTGDSISKDVCFSVANRSSCYFFLNFFAL